MKMSQAENNAEKVVSLDSTGRRKSFRRLFSRFADKTSMVGVPFINTARFWWAKLIWSFLLLAAVAAMTLHLWYLFDQWYSYPKTTTISLGFDKLPFPQVTICNTNKIHRGHLTKYDGASDLKALASDLDPRNLVPNQFDPDYYDLAGSTVATPTTTQNNESIKRATTDSSNRRKRFVNNYNSLNASKYDTDYTDLDEDSYLFDDYEYDSPVDEQTALLDLFTELFMEIDKYDREELGHYIEDMLVGCTFNGRKCNSSLFQLHQTSEYGNCYTVSSKRFISSKAGPKAGLSLVLFLETSEYLHGVTTGYGARLHLQERGSYPFPADEGIFIPAAMETDIGIKMLKIERLGGSYGKCDPGTDFKRFYNVTYTRRACQSFCLMSTVITNCSCFHYEWEEFAFARNKSLRPCDTEKEVKCLIDIMDEYYKNGLKCTCFNPCRETDFIQTISQRQWPTQEYGRVLQQWVCDEKPEYCAHLRNNTNDFSVISNNFLKVNIYYEDLNFEIIKESEQIELQQFLSDVGGAIGLWIGLSILSLCELIHLLVEIFYYFVHKTVKQRDLTYQERNRNGEKPRRRMDTNFQREEFDRSISDEFYDTNKRGNFGSIDSRYELPRSEYFQRPLSVHSRGNNDRHSYSNDYSLDRRQKRHHRPVEGGGRF